MSKEFKIGLIALVSGVLLYYGFNYLKGTNVLANTSKYYVEYPNTSGLNEGSPVYMQGVRVGRVSEITVQLDEKSNLVEMDVDGDIGLGDLTTAELASDGLLGGKAIVLNDSTVSGQLDPGSMLRPVVDPDFITTISETVTPVTDNLNTTIRRINEILLGMEGSGEAILETIKDLDKMIKSTNRVIDSNQESLELTLKNMAAMTARLNKDMEKLGPILDNMNAVSDSLGTSDLKTTIANTNALLKNMNATLDTLRSDQGTLGKLMKEDSLYVNLNKALVDFDKLLIHFNNYPKDFLKPLGKKNKKLKGPQIEE